MNLKQLFPLLLGLTMLLAAFTVRGETLSEAGVKELIGLPKIALEEPWIVPNDPALDPNTDETYATDLDQRACGELLQGLKFKAIRWTSRSCKIAEIVAGPSHGTLAKEGNGIYRYRPTRGFLGKDSVQYLVEGSDGRRILITLPISVRTLAEAFS